MPIYYHFLSGQEDDLIFTFNGIKHPHSLHSFKEEKLSHCLQMSYLALASGISSISASVLFNDSFTVSNHILLVQVCQF